MVQVVHCIMNGLNWQMLITCVNVQEYCQCIRSFSNAKFCFKRGIPLILPIFAVKTKSQVRSFCFLLVCAGAFCWYVVPFHCAFSILDMSHQRMTHVAKPRDKRKLAGKLLSNEAQKDQTDSHFNMTSLYRLIQQPQFDAGAVWAFHMSVFSHVN